MRTIPPFPCLLDRIRWSVLCLLALCLSLFPGIGGASDVRMLCDFEDAAALGQWEINSGEVRLVLESWTSQVTLNQRQPAEGFDADALKRQIAEAIEGIAR